MAINTFPSTQKLPNISATTRRPSFFLFLRVPPIHWWSSSTKPLRRNLNSSSATLAATSRHKLIENKNNVLCYLIILWVAIHAKPRCALHPLLQRAMLEANLNREQNKKKWPANYADAITHSFGAKVHFCVHPLLTEPVSAWRCDEWRKEWPPACLPVSAAFFDLSREVIKSDSDEQSKWKIYWLGLFDGFASLDLIRTRSEWKFGFYTFRLNRSF